MLLIDLRFRCRSVLVYVDQIKVEIIESEAIGGLLVLLLVHWCYCWFIGAFVIYLFIVARYSIIPTHSTHSTHTLM